MILMAIIGEVALLIIAVFLVVSGVMGAGIGCAMDSSGSKKSAWLLVLAVLGVVIGWAAIHYGPIRITFTGAAV